MWILPCALIEEISAIDAMRARMGAATAAATGHFSDGTVLQLHAMHGTTTTATTTMCVCVFVSVNQQQWRDAAAGTNTTTITTTTV